MAAGCRRYEWAGFCVSFEITLSFRIALGGGKFFINHTLENLQIIQIGTIRLSLSRALK